MKASELRYHSYVESMERREGVLGITLTEAAQRCKESDNFVAKSFTL